MSIPSLVVAMAGLVLFFPFPFPFSVEGRGAGVKGEQLGSRAVELNEVDGRGSVLMFNNLFNSGIPDRGALPTACVVVVVVVMGAMEWVAPATDGWTLIAGAGEEFAAHVDIALFVVDIVPGSCWCLLLGSWLVWAHICSLIHFLFSCVLKALHTPVTFDKFAN